MQKLHDLFNSQQLKLIEELPLFIGERHPTWFPLFSEQQRSFDHSVHSAVRHISTQIVGAKWLTDITPRLLDIRDINNASSSLAEIRAYGGLIDAGFSVTPILRSDDATPDFNINAGDGTIAVEVFAKHQDKEEDERLNSPHLNDAILPSGVGRSTSSFGKFSITTTIIERTPGGRPDPNKPNDSVQANMISRVCAIKKDERQIPQNSPALLIVDFTHFGGAIGSQFLRVNETTPISISHYSILTGSIWYALYGWKGAPIFEGYNSVQMQHDGRFRIAGEKKTKLSAVLVILTESAVLLENPWAAHRLPDKARLALCHYPFFDLSQSVADWRLGDANQLIELQRRMIEAIERQT
jgi:hypothetical protein